MKNKKNFDDERHDEKFLDRLDTDTFVCELDQLSISDDDQMMSQDLSDKKSQEQENGKTEVGIKFNSLDDCLNISLLRRFTSVRASQKKNQLNDKNKYIQLQ